MNILLVDDNCDCLEAIEAYLTWQDHVVTTATDGAEGFARYLQSPELYDVVLCDVLMPIMDGVSFLRQIRERKYQVPIVFTSVIDVSDEIDVVKEAIQLNPYQWLRKPFEFEELDELLNQVNAKRVLTSANLLATARAVSM